MIMKCNVCKENDSKYKCSNCLAPYCSLNCWKQHKTSTDCIKVEKNTNSTPEVKYQDAPEFHTEDRVSSEKLQQLENSEQLKNLVRNPHLRNMLAAVDNSPNVAQAIHEAMLEPIFVEFADECLKVVEDNER